MIFTSQEGQRSDFCVLQTQPRSDRESLPEAAQINRIGVPTISAKHSGVIKRCYGHSTRTQENEEPLQKKGLLYFE